MSAPAMASRKALRAALGALDDLARGESLKHSVSRALKSAGDLGPKERRFVAQSAREVAQHLRRIDAFLAQSGLELRRLIPEDRSLARMLALRLRVNAVPMQQALRELALPGPRRPRSVTDLELARAAQAMPEALTLPEDPLARRALLHSFPDWLMGRLAEAIPEEEELDDWLQATARPPMLDLRVNLSRAKPEVVMEELRQAGLAVNPGRFLEEALVAEDRALLFDLPAFKQGRVAVQDEGSQLIARMCGVKPGDRVLDACAGAGGKALALAALGAHVTATDGIPSRLRPLRERARLAGARIDIREEPPTGLFDTVLVDAPCSGLGALHREPDAKWRLTRESLAAFPTQQLQILSAAAECVRPGGRLVYATCSPLPAEDHEVVEKFLEGHTEFAAAKASLALGVGLARRLKLKGELQLFTHRHGTGSFFAALLVRKTGRSRAKKCP
jgi:16S rRNA (cytosine967-C5)-methyltransferase